MIFLCRTPCLDAPPLFATVRMIPTRMSVVLLYLRGDEIMPRAASIASRDFVIARRGMLAASTASKFRRTVDAEAIQLPPSKRCASLIGPVPAGRVDAAPSRAPSGHPIEFALQRDHDPQIPSRIATWSVPA